MKSIGATIKGIQFTFRTQASRPDLDRTLVKDLDWFVHVYVFVFVLYLGHSDFCRDSTYDVLRTAPPKSTNGERASCSYRVMRIIDVDHVDCMTNLQTMSMPYVVIVSQLLYVNNMFVGR